jgi:hypothetical protein
MTCTELNFVQSQHFYGLCIAKKAELPPITASESEWRKVLDRVIHLAHLSAKRQIAMNKRRKK